MIKGVHHIGLTTSDLDAATALFGAGLALEEARRFEVTDQASARALFQLDGVAADVRLTRAANGFLELFRFDAPASPPIRARGANEAGITHICIQTPAGEAALASLSGAGARFPHGLTSLGGDFRYGYGRIVDELIIEVEETAAAPDAGPESWIGHVAFATPDMDRLTGFYEALTGLRRHGGQRLTGHAAYDRITGLKDVDVTAAWIQGMNIGLEFWSYANPPTTPRADDRPVHEAGYSHVCFETDDVESDLARAIAAGGRPHSAVQDLGSARVAYLRDPDGNIVELLQWSASAAALSVDTLAAPDVLARLNVALDERRAAAKAQA
jgi:catechol 2,3-dioxygenase-like lactoylglutathione lyase family enzyme